MAPKMKKSSPSWIVCETCYVILTLKDQQLHLDNSCLIQRDKLLLHGFIKDEVLFSNLEELNSEECLKNISVNENVHYVFLSESAMQLCNIAIGSHVLIKSHSQSVVRVAWPMREKSLTSVLMTGDGIELFGEKAGTQLSIENLKAPPYPAAVITIEPLHPSSISDFVDSIMAFLPKVFLGKVFMNENKLFLRHFGKKLHFRVIKCHNVQSEEIVCGDNVEDTETIEKLKDLDLSDTTASKSYIVYVDTKFEIHSKSSRKVENFSISNIGGLADVITKLREFLDLAFSPHYRNLGIKHSNGCLLFGPMGTGKTLLVKSLSTQFPVTFIEIIGSEVYSKFFGEAESKLRGYFRLAKERSPCIVFIDEIDALCPFNADASSSSHHQEQRIVATLISLLDDLKNEAESENRGSVVVIGATSHLSALDPRLRCPGRLDLEVEIAVPQPTQRLDILQKITKQWHKHVFLADETVLENVAAATHGHVGADLASVCLHAVSCAVKRSKLESIDSSALAVQAEDFQWALSQVKPSAMREVLVEVPNVRWSDIGGQHQLKLKLRQAVEWPLRHPEAFERLGISPPKGLLMFGPPGCSKTMIAKALATESGLNFISIKGPELFSKWVGESERAVREVFRRARQVAPAVVFFDELDALGGERGAVGASGGGNVQERVLSQLLTEMDGVTPLSQVTVVAATNRPDRIDKALLRPGRLDQIIYVPLPDDETRREILTLQFKKSKFSDEVSLEEIVSKTEGYSGAEVLAVCHESGLIALEEDMNAARIEKHHLEKALNLIKPRTSQFLISLYEKYLLNK